jgi:hypothetical protein
MARTVQNWRGLGVAALVMAGWANSAPAQDDMAAFRTPSDNIHCLVVDGPEPVLRCDITDFKPSFRKRPADCDLEWGDAFELGATGKPGLVCHGDTVRTSDAPVLEHNTTFVGAGFGCRSERAGLTCANDEGHGFLLSKGRQILF